MHVFGKLLFFLGWGLAIWSAKVGLLFSVILLIGFIGTGGREYGGELAGMLSLTAVGFTTGYLLAKFGKLLFHDNK